MKNALLLTSFVTVLWGCDPSYSTEYSVVNNTDQNTQIVFFDEDRQEVDRTGGVYHYRQDTTSTRAIEKDSNLMLFIVDSDLSGSPALLTFPEDSIFVLFPDEKVIKFYPDSSSLSSGKNIYNVEEDWEETSDKNDYQYTFRITEEDLADAQK